MLYVKGVHHFHDPRARSSSPIISLIAKQEFKMFDTLSHCAARLPPTAMNQQERALGIDTYIYIGID